MKRSAWTTAIAAAAAMVVAIPLARGQEELNIPSASEMTESPQPMAIEGDCAACAEGAFDGRAQGSLLHWGHRRAARAGAHGAAGGRLHAAVGHMSAAFHAGSAGHQPLIDPWARADWIAQQRAATQSWHAGYYHTQWGGPVPLMVPPIARTQTRWGWGVAQTTVDPIYHQFKRPYPESVGISGGLINPLQATPRWPSHTDQFGVYYVRGPW